jgi:hypothetical protein
LLRRSRVRHAPFCFRLCPLDSWCFCTERAIVVLVRSIRLERRSSTCEVLCKNADPSGEYVVAKRRTPGSIATTSRYRWTGTDYNSPWELECEATMLEVDAEVRLHVCVSNLVPQFNGAEDVRTGPCPADTRPQCKCYDFLRKYRCPVAKDRACPGRKAPDRSGFDPNRVVETIFECGAENGLWILQSFRTDHLDG